MIRFLIIPIMISVGTLLLWGIGKVLFQSFLKPDQKKKDIDKLKGADMVLDPVCQTYLPKEGAIHKNFGGELVYFCSQKCLQGYKEKQGK